MGPDLQARCSGGCQTFSEGMALSDVYEGAGAALGLRDHPIDGGALILGPEGSLSRRRRQEGRNQSES
jgi:hypothetical protein